MSSWYYISAERIEGDRAYLADADERRHLMRVLRKKPGDLIQFVDGCGWTYEGVISDASSETVEITISSKREDIAEGGHEITLAPALLKGSRMDTVVEKAVELGVRFVNPLRTQHTIAGRDAVSDHRLERWQRIAQSAMKQSQRSFLPNVLPVTDFDDLIDQAAGYDAAFLAWEEESDTTLTTAATPYAHTDRHLMIIGPEGGFDRREIDLARQAGIHTVSLGPRRLRSDTAAIVALTLLTHAVGLAGAS